MTILVNTRLGSHTIEKYVKYQEKYWGEYIYEVSINED
jgi:hypothetical protein